MIASSRTLGSFRLLGLVPGATSTYRAERVEDGLPFALKIYRGTVDAEKWGRILAGLRTEPARSGPVCVVAEVGFQEGEVFAAAPWLEGVPLSRLVKAVSRRRDVLRDPHHVALVCQLIADAIEGVLSGPTERFEHPVFEPDLVSPQEIFVLFDGSVRVLDGRWTWLRAMATGSPWSGLDQNLAYALPRARFPRAGREAGRVWGVAVMLWEMLVGYRLFRRNTLESTLHAMNDGDVPNPHALNRTVPTALALLLGRVFANPAAISLREFAERLRGYVDVPRAEMSRLTRAWIADLVPPREELDSAESPLSSIDAVLEGARASWSAVEESTTCIIPPPSVRAEDLVQLSWLEDETEPRIRITRRRRAVRLGIPLVLGALGAALALWLAPRALEAEPEPVVSRSSARTEARPERGVETARSVPTIALEDVPVDAGSPPERAPSVEPSRALPADRRLRDAGSRASAPLLDRVMEVEAAVSGDLFVAVAEDVQVSSLGRPLGQGRFRTRLPVGVHVLELKRAGVTISTFPIDIRPGTLNVIEAN